MSSKKMKNASVTAASQHSVKKAVLSGLRAAILTALLLAGAVAAPVFAQEYGAWEADYFVSVSAPDGGVNFRQGPGVEYQKLIDEMIPNRTVLHVTAEAQASNGNNWGLTEYEGQAGWIALTQVSRTETPAEPKTAAREAGIEFVHSLENAMESATVTKYDENGGIVWQYVAGSYEAAQCDRVSELGLCGERYFLVEDGSVLALDAGTGTIVWENTDFAGVGTEKGYAFGSDGTLYISGYLGPDLFIADREGKTLYRKDMFDSNIVWPYEMELDEESGCVKIHFESNANGGDAWIQVHLDQLEYH